MLWKCLTAGTLPLCRNVLKVEFFTPKSFFCVGEMAKSKFEYVREFESHSKCLPNCFIVVRVDGKGFHKFTEAHGFEKPNDKHGLLLMSKAAACVMEEFTEICCAYGQSDEFSFIFHRDANVYNRRADKITSVVNSLFTSSYVFHWNKFILKPLKYPPAFDSRIILYPTIQNLRDYLCWRQADCHVNNLYNTAFWGLVQKCGHSKQEAQKILSGTLSSEKHEIMFKDCNLNYNNECELYKKGTMLIKSLVQNPKSSLSYHTVHIPLNCDIMNDKFWLKNPQILDNNLDTPILKEVDNCECVFVKFKNVDALKLRESKKKNRNAERKNESKRKSNDVSNVNGSKGDSKDAPSGNLTKADCNDISNGPEKES